MTGEIPPSSQKKSEDEAQGQRMTIYMPPGAVIIERSELEEPTEVVATQIQSEEPQVSSESAKESLQSYGSVINIYTSDEARGIKQQSHLEVPIIENTQLNDQQVLLRISQMLDVITRRLDHNDQPTQSVIRKTIPEEVIEEKPAILLEDHKREEKYVPIVLEDRKLEDRYVAIGPHFDWMHAFNIIYISLILFSLILPAGLSSIFNTEAIAATTSYEAAGIQRGDLLITELAPASALVVNDFVNMHNAFSGTSEMLQVSEISAPGVNGEVTLSVPPQAGQNLGLSYTVNGNLNVNKVAKSVPKLGYVQMILGSFYVQLFICAFVILLNIIVHYRRHRRYSRSLRRYAYQ